MLHKANGTGKNVCVEPRLELLTFRTTLVQFQRYNRLCLELLQRKVVLDDHFINLVSPVICGLFKINSL